MIFKGQRMLDYFRVGVIANSHGVKGEVKVYPTTDDITRFKELETVFLDENNSFKELHIKSVKFVKNMVVLGFEEYNNMNDILGLKGMELYVNRENAIPLKEGEFYVADMVGADIITDEGKHFGTLKDILKTGANDVYVVESDDGNEVLFPSIPECILEKDFNNKTIKVHIMDGLID